MNQNILDWQNSFNEFGISYQGPKDGHINEDFLESILEFEKKYNAFGEVLAGEEIKLTASAAKEKYLQRLNPANDIWIQFLSQDLPGIGKVYQGNLEESAKKLESFISKKINHPMDGVIWDNSKKNFTTTPEDIRKSLNLISLHFPNEPVIQATYTMDERFVKMSQMLKKIF